MTSFTPCSVAPRNPYCFANAVSGAVAQDVEPAPLLNALRHRCFCGGLAGAH